jgi:glycosyltransferase involved in cell wall biosynthesis
VVTAHAGDLLKMTHSHARQCIKETDCILAVSNAIKDRVSLVAKGHQCIVKYNSLDQAALNILAQKRSKMVSNADKSSIRVIQLVTVARLVPKKGLLNIVKAASNLKRSGIQFKWTLIGDGSQKEELLASISSNYLDNYVILAGSMLNTQALSFLISQDLFVGAFQDVGSDIDGLPHVLLEAAMAKLPIATTILAGISDLFDKSNCFVIQRSEPELIAMKIQEFLQSSQSDIEDKINRAHLTVSNVTSLSVQAMLLRKAYLIPFAHS